MSARILFVSENIALSQLVRLLVLARSLDPARYEVHFAASSFDPSLFGETSFRRWTLPTVEPRLVFEAVEKGRRPYSARHLERYVEDDLALIRAVDPHLIVGDMRLSLAVSAPLCSVPYAPLINAYWSPFALRDGFPMPEHPMVRAVGVERASRFYPMVLPRVLAHFAAPLNSVRQKHGLPPVGDLLHMLTHGDFTLYPDVPELTPVRSDLPARHRFLGPLTWSPDMALPAFWDRLDPGRPLVYATMGSTGAADKLPAVLAGLGQISADVVVATLGRHPALAAGERVFFADLLPGDRVCERAALVVCNGGASTAYQALAAGVPVLGIPRNFDQYLAMDAIERAGAGVLLRSGLLTAEQVSAKALLLLGSTSARDRASALQKAFRRAPATLRFGQWLEQTLGPDGRPRRPAAAC